MDGYHEENKPETYHRESWALVRQPYLNTFQYRFALLQAEHACRLAGDRQEYRIGLGAALYPRRPLPGSGRESGGSRSARQGFPAAMAFLAMAHHRLGQHEQARANLAHLHEPPRPTAGMKDAEALDLMRKAQALITPPRATIER